MKLLNKVVLVTGAASGIGKTIAVEFAKEGAYVAVNDVSKDGEATVEIIKKIGGKAVFCQADVRDESHVTAMMDYVIEAFGKIDILINNAGVSIRKNIIEAGEEEWTKTMDTNLKGAWLCCKYAIPLMIENGGGCIINIASTHSFRTQPNHFPYQSAKAGMIALTNGICVDFGLKGIRANNISPGFIATPLAFDYLNEFPNREEKIQKIKSAQLTERLGTPEDVAKAAIFLASDDANFIYGANLIVDGGRSIYQKTD
ncbi:SDR family oxidoreductase [Mesobacillus foraminis]|uniref:SDR family NAD(P)-dependent oxidoreductase n=1 Tax=Mesobacillus foraminis TaxID=279826 RepID=UPI001BE8C484|nr:SDR family oxidoreductase [Mesobacillus foraminis]MBT2757836.1 SDR family oxidoreductase [Mesobacillus foraminis]